MEALRSFLIFKLKRKAGKGSLVIWFCALFSLAKCGGRGAAREKSRAFLRSRKSSVFHSDDADGSDNLCLELFKIVSGFLCLSRRGLLGLHKQAGISQIAFFRTFFSKKYINHHQSNNQLHKPQSAPREIPRCALGFGDL